MDTTYSEINTTPLIDVMLVLLMMFMLTIPLSTHRTTINVQPGKQSPPVTQVTLEIDFDGRMFWNGSAIADEAQLLRYLRATAADPSQPLLRIEPDRRAPYEHVARVLAAAQRSHVERLAVTGIGS
jgi:biopolymer transport protein ExbD